MANLWRRADGGAVAILTKKEVEDIAHIGASVDSADRIAHNLHSLIVGCGKIRAGAHSIIDNTVCWDGDNEHPI